MVRNFTRIIVPRDREGVVPGLVGFDRRNQLWGEQWLIDLRASRQEELTKNIKKRAKKVTKGRKKKLTIMEQIQSLMTPDQLKAAGLGQ